MDRKEFLAQLGIGSAAALAITCLHACSKEGTGGSAVDFTIDLNSSQFSALKNQGGFVGNITAHLFVINSCLNYLYLCDNVVT
ncbi:MAG: hypothetical protein LW706_00040 [Chitinophagaceae bacterium]|nr:hypothetical protein [Chitinophagaceae bacterium]